jgi:hypothetical protein
MKKYILLSLALVTVLATGCPVGLDHPLDAPNANPIDKELLGTWINAGESAEVKQVIITEASPTQYNIEVLERGEMYALETDKLVAWVTTLNKGNFLYVKPENEEKFYHYQYRFDGSDLLTNDVSLLDGGMDAVVDTKSLRKQVQASMSNEEWGQEIQTWTKE